MKRALVATPERPAKRPRSDEPPSAPRKVRPCRGCELDSPSQRDHAHLHLRRHPMPTVAVLARYSVSSGEEENDSDEEETVDAKPHACRDLLPELLRVDI